ncbi:hypothetical protein LO771_24260 [Streptacidiphilus sp. ASG 303]|uniref:hypothetical protein n=1 Tax=Streptacidiphilus sp. ASG 303 TaxID=2896847 RepID=UPI001E2A0285|nr:hypothetical protein [Streptacidiphilus sp. ASG 303]MCD0485413.1 hypothetical protein [Streptacidiphilus sp. ASG 303]
MPELKLTHLTYAGSGLPLAQVTFGDGLTIICGDSDTGKSFIVDSIDYMLAGRQKAPSVSRSAGYSQILLGMLLPDGSPLTLVRAPGNNSIRIYLEDLRDLVHEVPHAIVSARRATSGQDLSSYLLGCLGLDGAYVRTNEEGRTEPLRFADILNLAVVTDARIDSVTPPSQRTRSVSYPTRARSVMRFVLTREDEPVAEGPNAAQRRVQRGKIAFIDQLVIDALAKLKNKGNLSALREQLTRLDETLQDATRSHHAESERQAVAIAARTRISEQESLIASRLIEITDLINRFVLLRQQYESDLDRLAMVSEAGNLLGYFEEGTCIFCGAEPEHQNPQHHQVEATQLHQAVAAEIHKTRALLADLKLTINDMDDQCAQVATELAQAKAKGDALDMAIAESGARLEPLAAQLDEVLARRTQLQRDLDVLSYVEELDAHRVKLAGDSSPARRAPSYIPVSAQIAFERILRDTLESWHVPAVEHATWDPYDGDVHAGGSPRASRGRGIRALLHAGFSTAMAQYCVEQRSPHLGFLVLDSPLVTFGQLVADDVQVPFYVKDYFYRHYRNFPMQSVIVENSRPPADVIEGAHVIVFGATGDRQGFFPEGSQ